MMVTREILPVLADSPESRRYNRIKRWLGISDFALGFGLLVVLLATGWTGWLRDVAERAASQNYFFAVFFYVLMLVLISKVLEIPLLVLGRMQELADRVDYGPDCRRTTLHAHTLGPAALVGRGVDCFLGTFCAGRATRASSAVSNFLQIRAAGERGTQAPPDCVERTRRHARTRRLQVASVRKKQEGQCRANRSGRHPA